MGNSPCVMIHSVMISHFPATVDYQRVTTPQRVTRLKVKDWTMLRRFFWFRVSFYQAKPSLFGVLLGRVKANIIFFLPSSPSFLFLQKKEVTSWSSSTTSKEFQDRVILPHSHWLMKSISQIGGKKWTSPASSHVCQGQLCMVIPQLLGNKK